ncbi:MAG: polyisoprenoid-binding protein YceI [Neolewinella sp.]|jgi:polyisoprenoid-binding protein YceI
MFKSLLLTTAFFFALATVATAQVDADKSLVTWKGYKVTGEHAGTISVADSSSLDFKEGVLTGGTIFIDMPSIAVTDLTGGTKAKLEGHLKSADFFGVEKFPTAKLVITTVVSRGTPGDYRVTAEITIKENTETIRFNTKVTEEMGAFVAVADITVDRTDFDVRYGSGSFIDNLGDKTIYDEFDLTVKLVAKPGM